MSGRIVLYRLGSKFINQRTDVPETAKQVVYYSLAVGHHVGVMDLFSPLAEVSLEEYQNWIAKLPEGAGRAKLEGALKWGEIEVNRTHVETLLPLVEAAGDGMAPWASALADCLRSMVQEPALYVMVRKMA